ncbi:MAG: hypothetical protein RLY30_1437 [Pseudomonadota bacterium]|jgi:MFS family permease
MQDDQERIPRHSHYTLFLLVLGYVANYVDRNIINVLIEPIKQEFGVSDTLMGLVTGLLFALFYAFIGVFMGRLADRTNRVRLMGIYVMSWSGMTMLCGLAGNFIHLALARVGVAVAEAGSAPTSLSLIADSYPQRRRSLAMGIFSLGAHIGLLVGMGLGGYVAFHYGWRAAFLVVGAPGIALGVLMLLTLKEPPRGRYDPQHKSPEAAAISAEPLRTSLRFLFQQRAYFFVCVGAAIAAIQAYSVGIWGPSFLMRSHGLSVKDAGLLLGLISVGGAFAGALFSGWLTDTLAARNRGWQVGVPILGLLLATPAGLAYFLWPQGLLGQLGPIPVPVAALFGMLHGFFTTWWIAPSMAAISTVSVPQRRSLANAVFLFLFTIAGMGVGPMIVGAVSDLLEPSLGKESLRYAMAMIVATAPLAAWVYARAIKPYRDEVDGKASTTS